MEEVSSFIYGVDEAPGWFMRYQEKTELNTGGVATVYLYPENTSKQSRMFRVFNVITHEDVYEW